MISFRTARRAGTLLAVLALLLALTATAFAGNPVTKETGKSAAALSPTLTVFPCYDDYFFGPNQGTCPASPVESPADAYQLPGASGKVNLIQPNGNVDVIIAVSADGLVAGKTYNVWIDTDGITSAITSAGPWANDSHPVGSFTADAYGHGAWNYTAPAGTFAPGPYVYSVWINQADVNAGLGTGNFTVLISQNLEFIIATE